MKQRLYYLKISNGVINIKLSILRKNNLLHISIISYSSVEVITVKSKSNCPSMLHLSTIFNAKIAKFGADSKYQIIYAIGKSIL